MAQGTAGTHSTGTRVELAQGTVGARTHSTGTRVGLAQGTALAHSTGPRVELTQIEGKLTVLLPTPQSSQNINHEDLLKMTIGLPVTRQLDPINTWQVSKAMVELYHETKRTKTRFNKYLVALHGAEQHAEDIHWNGVKHCTLWMFITINYSNPHGT